MSDNTAEGRPWSDQEIDLTLESYFRMLTLELAGERLNKAEENRRLQDQIGRSRGAIEFKHCNITAVLEYLGMQTIEGYRPRSNFQGALIEGIGRYLGRNPRLFSDGPQPSALSPKRVAEERALILEPPPVLSELLGVPNELRPLVRKFDAAERDARNRALGKLGEERIFNFEQERLRAEGRQDLASKVRWVSEEDGDGAGYDILSFDRSGSERLLEVKTTNGGVRSPFFLSENERNFSLEREDAFRLVRVYNFQRGPHAFEIEPPLARHLHLRPVNWRADFGAAPSN